MVGERKSECRRLKFERGPKPEMRETAPAGRRSDFHLLALLASILTVVPFTSCVSKAAANAQARAAFLAGQQQAMQQAQMRQAQTQIHGPTVTFVGPLKNSLLPWTADLTLAKAFVAADYYGPTDPQQIVIVRE